MAILAVLIGGTGCYATFRGNGLTRISLQRHANRSSKSQPSIFCSISWRYDNKRDNERSYRSLPFIELIKGEFKSSGLFSEVTTNELQRNKLDYEAKINMTVSQNKAALEAIKILSGVSLMTIPTFHRIKYLLEIELIKKENTIGSFQYNDHVTMCFHLTLMPLLFFPKKTEERVQRNMIRYALHDIQRAINSGFRR